MAGATGEWTGRLVLRVVSGTDAAVLREAAAQAGAFAAGLPAPRVLHVEASADAVGAPFMVMEFLPGRPVLGGIEWYRFARDFPALIGKWPRRFATVAALIASADAAPAIRAAAEYGVTREQLLTGARLVTRIEEVLGATPGWMEPVAWLRANEPPLPDPLRMVHGDLWPANVLLERERVVGLVDWTTGGLGDPALDVGFAKVGLALMPEPFPPPPPISTGIGAAGRRMARQIHELTAERVGSDARVAYYEALRCLMQLAEVEADRRADRTNGWEHGIAALTRHFSAVSGVRAPLLK